jgi:hypothetical protein
MANEIEMKEKVLDSLRPGAAARRKKYLFGEYGADMTATR